MRQFMLFNFSKISKIIKTDFFSGIFILIVAYLYIGYLKNTERPVVTVSNGKLKGVLSFSRDYLKYHAYYGIPYAKPPVGPDLRFEPPQPPENWDGVRDAGYYRSQCISLELMFVGGVLFGEEDCLFLNVFVPQNRKVVRPFPVMVFFHGGMFHFGSAEDHGEKYFMDEDVILVTLTYRLGALGFLSTGDDVVRGNQGLKDQTMALRWIQENIHFFGGDPTKVTIFGESAGGAAVGFHILSPLSSGLFDKAITQSGAPLSSWALIKQSAAQSKRFASKFGCPTQNTTDMVHCLKQIDAKTLVYGHMEGIDYFRTRPMVFTPTVEAVNDSSAFLIEDPLKSLEKGNFGKIPWIMGINADEGLLFSSALSANLTKLLLMSQFELSLPVTLQYEKNDKISNQIQQHYFEKLLANATREDFLRNLTNLFSDRHFNQPLTRTARLYSKHAPLYLYHFNYSGFFSIEHFIADRETQFLHPILSLLYHQTFRIIQEFIFGIKITSNGTCHSDELPLLFNHPWTPSIYSKLPERDVQMSKDVVRLWVSFARSWNTLTLGKVQWKPLDPSKPFKYLDISRTPSIIDEPFTERVNFWESIVDKLEEPAVF
ncbi:unnamed protein product [Orchesella dallaii]|uniref:Carboxylic ester hydrolase n=1 Tax=Orchesella dallaii TaxID=48710 RepID=A0ABP1Q765_9HEXA